MSECVILGSVFKTFMYATVEFKKKESILLIFTCFNEKTTLFLYAFNVFSPLLYM